MFDIALTKMSSKGQIVVPIEMRTGFKEGDKIIMIKNNDQLIMKNVKKFEKNVEDDLIFAKRTEEAWKRYEKGEFKEMDFDDFMKEVKKW